MFVVSSNNILFGAMSGNLSFIFDSPIYVIQLNIWTNGKQAQFSYVKI